MKTIEASMAGTVLNILVSVGEQVNAGDTVALLESMKMEIPVESTVSGVVKEVNFESGDFVNEGDALLVLE
ncbi:MAG TPA: biotin/lipoyl-containing protein [Candidatus Angelobacter sp.]|nr:biotin/lipoyl-containing protein [Candidatus Angelobacter sp.]